MASFSDLFSVYLKTIDHLHFKLLIFCKHSTNDLNCKSSGFWKLNFHLVKTHVQTACEALDLRIHERIPVFTLVYLAWDFPDYGKCSKIWNPFIIALHNVLM